MKVHYARTFHQSKLSDADKKRCHEAVTKFTQNPQHPGLNFEIVGSTGNRNHCSIRASKELRVILAVEPDLQTPEDVMLVHMGHHNDAYQWSKRQKFHTDLQATDCFDLETDAKLGAQLKKFSTMDEWMLFLHPDQKPLAQRRYSREARIRGGAGTGKTVIALHRAAELGHRYPKDKILFVTYVKSLSLFS